MMQAIGEMEKEIRWGGEISYLTGVFFLFLSLLFRVIRVGFVFLVSSWLILYFIFLLRETSRPS